MTCNHLILCRPLLLLPSIFPRIRVFSNKSALCIRWPKYWSFSISPSSEYSELVSFRMDWLDLLAVQETLKSFLQHHSSKASILQRVLIWVPSNTDINQQCLNVTSRRHRPHSMGSTGWIPGALPEPGLNCKQDAICSVGVGAGQPLLDWAPLHWCEISQETTVLLCLFFFFWSHYGVIVQPG